MIALLAKMNVKLMNDAQITICANGLTSRVSGVMKFMPSEDRQQQVRMLDDLMARLYRAMNAQHIIKNVGLTGTQSFVLRHLHKHDQSKASDLAKVALLSPGAVTQVCDELVRLGLVERTRSVDDRRVVYVNITDAGQRKLEEITQIRSRKMVDLLDKLGADGDTFVRIVGRVVEIIEQNAKEATEEESE